MTDGRDEYKTFLGAHNSNAERKWVNLYTNEELTYTQWSFGQPDNVGNAEKVAEMWTSNGDWNDIDLSSDNDRGTMCISKGIHKQYESNRTRCQNFRLF